MKICPWQSMKWLFSIVVDLGEGVYDLFIIA
jgi:hypothetical protein